MTSAFAAPTPTHAPTNPPRLEPLEPRVLLSATPVTGVLPSIDPADPAYDAFIESAGVIDVTHLPDEAKALYGVGDAIPDDGLDDTASIQAAISWALGSDANGVNNYNRNLSPPFIYLRDGVYNVSDTLESKDLLGTGFSSGWRRGLQLVGESRDGTILRLDDDAPGFNAAAAAPKAVIKTGSPLTGQASNPSGGGNQAFEHSIYNLTIDVGADNPNAVGLEYLANNRGAVEDVLIISSDPELEGRAGLGLTLSQPGPALIKHVEIVGFDYGIESTPFDYGLVLEHITLRDSRVAGLLNDRPTLSIRGLTYTGPAPAIVAGRPQSNITLVEADLRYTGTDPDAVAIDNAGQLFARDVTATNYAVVIDNDGNSTFFTENGDVAGGDGETFVDHYSSHPGRKLFDGGAHETLRLEIKETPEYHTDDLSLWINVEDYGATAGRPGDLQDGNDDALGIQAAIDAAPDGAIVYLPAGDYYIDGEILLKNRNVRKVVGMNAGIIHRGDGDPATDDVVFRFDGAAPTTTIVEHLTTLNGVIVHEGAGTLALRHVGMSGVGGYRGVAGSGDLFIEDVRGGPNVVAGQNVWARQWNAEFRNPDILFDDARAWVLGYKTEGQLNTGLKITNGSTVELLGGVFYSQDITDEPRPADNPAIEIVDSTASLSFTIANGDRYETLVRETRGAETRDLTRGQDLTAGEQGWFRMTPLLTSYAEPDTTPAAFVVDDDPANNGPDASVSFVGDWAFFQDNVEAFGVWDHGSFVGRFHHDRSQGKGAKSAAFEHALPDGRYEALLRWPRFNGATNVPVDVVHAGGTTTVVIDQSVDRREWVSLGSYDFTGAGRVVIRTDGSVGQVRADAVKFVEDRTHLQESFLGTPPSFLDRVQAEDFDLGGEGVAYSDNGTSNVGGAYRPAEAVDITTTTDADGGFKVGWNRAGEWLEYTLEAARGVYDLDLRVAKGDFLDTRIDASLDGRALGTGLVFHTGGWETWRTVTIEGVEVNRNGLAELRLDFVAGEVDLNWLRFRPAAGSTAFAGTAPALDTRIEAEDFDVDGPGLAYVDSTPGNTGGVYRATGVDLEATTDVGGGYNVGYLTDGERLDYTLDVQPGTYDISFRVASGSLHAGGLRATLGSQYLGEVDVPDTGNWQAWTTLTLTGVEVDVLGAAQLSLFFDDGSFNLNWIEFTRVA